MRQFRFTLLLLLSSSFLFSQAKVSDDYIAWSPTRKLTAGDFIINILHNDSTNKQKRIIQEIDNSDLLILIETENVYKSQWVQLEIKRARQFQKPIKRILVKDLKRLLS